MLNLSPDEVAILRSWRSRAPDDQQLSAVLEKFRPLWLPIARRSLGDQAEEAIQEAFLKILQKIDTLQDPEKVEAWACTTLTHTIIDIHRHIKRVDDRRQYPGEQEDDLEQWVDKLRSDTASSTRTPEQEYEVRERLRRVHECVERLPVSKQQLFELSFLKGLSGAETAERLSISYERMRHSRMEIRHTFRDAEGDSK